MQKGNRRVPVAWVQLQREGITFLAPIDDEMCVFTATKVDDIPGQDKFQFALHLSHQDIVFDRKIEAATSPSPADQEEKKWPWELQQQHSDYKDFNMGDLDTAMFTAAFTASGYNSKLICW